MTTLMARSKKTCTYVAAHAAVYLNIDDRYKMSHSEHCAVHSVPASVVTFEDISSPEPEELAKGLRWLVLQEADIKYGDLVKFKCTEEQRPRDIFIFDGKDIIELEFDPCENGNLPFKFRVIEEVKIPGGEKRRFPITYWHPEDGSGIPTNSYIWFDYRPYLKTILERIDYSDHLYGDKWSIHSWFIADDDKAYKLVYCYQDYFSDRVDPVTFKIQNGHVQGIKDMLIEKLTKEEPFFPLESHPLDDCYPEKERVLYIS